MCSQSFGFREFDGFLTICTRLAIKLELRAAQLQLQKHRLLYQPQLEAGGSNASITKARRAFEVAAMHFAAVSRLDGSCEEIYERHIQVSAHSGPGPRNLSSPLLSSKRTCV